MKLSLVCVPKKRKMLIKAYSFSSGILVSFSDFVYNSLSSM